MLFVQSIAMHIYMHLFGTLELSYATYIHCGCVRIQYIHNIYCTRIIWCIYLQKLFAIQMEVVSRKYLQKSLYSYTCSVTNHTERTANRPTNITPTHEYFFLLRPHTAMCNFAKRSK